MTQAATKPLSAQVDGKDRMLKFTVSGSYYNAKKEVINFDNVQGVIPFCDEDNGVGSMHVRDRYIATWIKNAVNEKGEKLYPEHVHKMHQTFIDNVEEVTGKLSFVGKNIKELTVDEMQDLATSKDLRFIPLPNSGLSKRDMLIRTYVAYSEKILRRKIKYQEEGFNFAKLNDITLDANTRFDISKKLTNEEMIEMEQNGGKPTAYGEKDDPRKRFTMEELLAIADQKDLDVPENASFNDLYDMIFSQV